MSLQNKEMINQHIKGLYKTFCYKIKFNFFQFFFSHWRLHKCFFFFLIKAFANFEKLIRFHQQAFIVYKNGGNLKMLIEIFCQKLIVSNVILAFLDHLKPKNLFAVDMVADIERHPFSKSLDPPLICKKLSLLSQEGQQNLNLTKHSHFVSLTLRYKQNQLVKQISLIQHF